MHTDGRLRIEVIEEMLEPSSKCSRRITNIIHERLEPKGFTWKEVSKATKEFYFEEFKKWFVWTQPDNIIYEGFMKNAAIRYKDLRSRARAHWEKNSELDNRIGKDVWLSWIEDWKTPDCQAKSKRKRENRKGGADQESYPPTHTGGSASSRTIAARLARDWERDPDAVEMFHYSHTKKHDRVTFINPKDAKIAETIKALRAERSQAVDGSSPAQPVDENKLFYDAVGGRNNRNKIYGLGATQNIFYGPSSSNITKFSSSLPNNQDYQKLETELKDMKEQLKEMDEMKQRMREMENLLARVLNTQN